jgi:hypothetical protein
MTLGERGGGMTVSVNNEEPHEVSQLLTVNSSDQRDLFKLAMDGDCADSR